MGPTLLWLLPPGTPGSHSEELRKILSWLWQGKGKIIIMKYAQSILPVKGPLSRAKDFIRTLSYLGGHFTLVFLPHQSRGEKPRHTYEGYSPRTKAHLKTKI